MITVAKDIPTAHSLPAVEYHKILAVMLWYKAMPQEAFEIVGDRFYEKMAEVGCDSMPEDGDFDDVMSMEYAADNEGRLILVVQYEDDNEAMMSELSIVVECVN